MTLESAPESPVSNEEFFPDARAQAAPQFCGALRIAQTCMTTLPELSNPQPDGRDARLFPGVTLRFITDGDVLVPLQRGEIVPEGDPGRTPSYWCVIPQFGRVWRNRDDNGWSRAAFALMLVHDTENHSHHGLAMFKYKGRRVSDLRFQFVQQTAPYLLKQHFVAWGRAPVRWNGTETDDAPVQRERVRAELARRLPHKPWEDLAREFPPGTLDGFGGPVSDKWLVQTALIRNGTLYYHEVPTPYGDYPYPLEMRFGVRSVMKSIGVPLALLRLAQVYGRNILRLRIGDYVEGLDRQYRRVRFIDAAMMASGIGAPAGVPASAPGVYDASPLAVDYDAWYTAPSHRAKLLQINRSLHPFPWRRGSVMQYQDQDFYLLGVALDRFLKAVRGPHADIWEMLKSEVFARIGIDHAPTVRTREEDGMIGVACLNAGYYPTLDELGKIALLYQNFGAAGGKQILHQELTRALMKGRAAIEKGEESMRDLAPGDSPESTALSRYKLGFHFTPYVSSRNRRKYYLPTMWGWGGSEVILYPNSVVSIRIAKAAALPPGEAAYSGTGLETVRAVDRMMPF